MVCAIASHRLYPLGIQAGGREEGEHAVLGWIPWIPWIYPACSTPQGGVQGCWHPMASIYLPSGGPHGRRARRPPGIGALQYPPYGMACP